LGVLAVRRGKVDRGVRKGPCQHSSSDDAL